MSKKDTTLMEENRRLKKEKKELERDLRRKEKALAEMAALVTLKKKPKRCGGTKGTNDFPGGQTYRRGPDTGGGGIRSEEMESLRGAGNKRPHLPAMGA